MKRFLSVLLILLSVISSAHAGERYCCSVPQNLACGFTRVTTNCLGMNFTAKKVASKIIKHELNKNFKGDYEVKIDSFSAPDLKRGKVKSVHITGKNLYTKGVSVSEVNIDTLCDYNYVEYNKKPMVFHTDVPLKFQAFITEEDLNKTFIDMGYLQQFTDLNIYGVSFFKIENVQFKLKNNKIYLIVSIKAPLLMGERVINLMFTAKLNVENGMIVIDNIIAENLRSICLDKFIEKLNTMNIFAIPVKIFTGVDSSMYVDNIKVLENRLCVDGTIVIKRNDDGQKEKEK